MALPTAPQRDSAAHSSASHNSADFEKDRDLLRAILSSAVTHGASDIHIRAEAQPVLRVSGDLWPLEMDPLTPEQAESMVLAAMNSEREREELREIVDSERKKTDEAEKKRKSAVEELESIRADPELFLAGMKLPGRAVAVKPPAEDDDFDPES